MNKFDAAMPDGLVVEGQRRGLDIVIVELPWNRHVLYSDGTRRTELP